VVHIVRGQITWSRGASNGSSRSSGENLQDEGGGGREEGTGRRGSTGADREREKLRCARGEEDIKRSRREEERERERERERETERGERRSKERGEEPRFDVLL